MLFSSIAFLYWFLPVVLVLYFAVPRQWKNLVLFLVSLFFYFYGEPVYLLLMLFTSVSGYLHGLWIGRARGTRFAKVPVVSSVATSLGLLAYFKYADFLLANVNAVFRTDLPMLGLALPIGISFYTFATLTYAIDAYRGTVAVQRDPLRFATYISMFPHLVAGPIVRYATIEHELAQRTHSFADFASGVNRFVLGLAKKVLVANVLGEFEKAFAASDEKTVLFHWAAAVAFTLHIYFDFSGYSDMAIGLARMFGFHFLENFDYPLTARSITEFWRRWHISLGTWFRDYVYIPLGGNRVPLARWILNVCVVWFLTGFWHGAQWNFIVWGAFFAVFLILEKLWLRVILDKLPSAFRHLYLLFLIVVSFAVFNANGMPEVLIALRGLFGAAGLPLSSAETFYFLRSYAIVFAVAAFGATPIATSWVRRLRAAPRLVRFVGLLDGLQVVYLFVLLALSTAYLVDGSFNPFLYFRF